MNFDLCVHPWNHHYSQGNKYSSLQKVPLCLFSVVCIASPLPSWSQANTDLVFCSFVFVTIDQFIFSRILREWCLILSTLVYVRLLSLSIVIFRTQHCYSWVVFHCMEMPEYFYPFTSCWTIWVVSGFDYYKAAMSICDRFVWTYIFILLDK